MSLEWWLGFAVFAVVSSVTPGPNNMLLLASGLHSGIRRSMPLVLGIAAGFGGLLLGAGLGVAAALRKLPWLETALLLAGAAYLLWLAWRIAAAPPPAAPGAAPARLGFRHGALLQLVNPKAWMMALSAVGLYLPAGEAAALPVMLLTFLVLGLPCTLLWVWGGRALVGLAARPARLRLVNGLLALALVGSVLLLFLR